ncbi:putative tetratricopeptide-like helical domain superfamily [Helianthus annuus]|uniref:Putative tetratricopeptide-like helical domain-containing protein n=1 Tax=Helianthus annuus TaxID=4232 RepID=A0A251SBY2_HELAN|nr:inactive TPR repeat-containing thioredoxin TTL3 [Helianthus annuus]KAF5766428.1 putative tetratricopeptide-like helical domain superfamily [Helianthus annuus]KAJ0452810.1 putative tetratricopeptide-like helical domain superfamily, TPR repeat-containing thioredoxin TTL1-4 [Helianthus annuus]KAJ0457824.1 putative tetratricopeptide-like helical domain superfamily [Helianthus annuus]KAJ0474724.1 putative tetratricopeptide-like helical domain superfamily, TPR repeat-containing thioredoxin TTL1-4 
MAGPPHHIAGKDTGCGFIGAIFGTRQQRKTPPVPRLEASKEHRQPQFPGHHTSKRPPRTRNHTPTELVYTGFAKPIEKPPPPTIKKPATLQTKPVVKPTCNNSPFKPATLQTKPVVKPTSDHSPFKGTLYNVSQVTNMSYTKQLRKEPSFTSSELSLRISVRGTPTSGGSVYGTSLNQIPGHLGNLMRKKPDIAKSYGKLGNIYGSSGNKTDPEVFKNIGNEKYKQGRFEEAIKLYTEAIGIDSKVACYYSNRSAALIGLGKFIDAILDCKIAIRINPSYHRAHYRLASLYLRFGETAKALCHYKCSGEKAERHDLAKAQAIKSQLLTCSAARNTKDWKRLLKESQFAYSLGADSSLEVYAMQTEALLNLHKHDEAYSCFQNAPVIDVNIAARLFGSTVTSYFLMVQAQVYLASGRFEEAVNVSLRASELDPSEAVFVVARKTRALAKARANGNKIFKASQFYEACKAYSEGLEHEPYNSVLLCNRAACRYKLGQFERAVEDCTIALNLRPSYAKVRLRRAQCNAKLERWEAAIQDYDVLNHETRGDEAVEREFLEARMQLEKQNIANTKPVKLINDSNTEEFGGFLIAV